MPQTAGRDLLYRHWWLGGGIVLLAVVLVLSLAPLSLVHEAPDVSDKVLHLLTYMILMLWFSGVIRAESRGWLFAGLLVFGGVIEVLQSMTGYRSMELADLVANGTGLLLGWQLVRRGLSQWCNWVEQWLRE
jgi:VanZ family protein